MFGIQTFPDGQTTMSRVVFGTFSFQTNAGSSPSTATFSGSLRKRIASVTYSATGIYTIVFVKGFVFPTLPIIETSNTTADNTGTNQFYATQTGVATQVAGVLTVVIQTNTPAGVAMAVPNTAGNRVQFSLEGIDESPQGT